MRFTVPDEVAGRLRAAAIARGVRVEDAVIAALTEWIGRQDRDRPDVPIAGIGRGVEIDRLSHESRGVIESLFGGGGLLPEGTCGAALDYFTSHALYRLVWRKIDRTFDEHSRPRTRWEDHDVLVLSWHYATDGREIQAVRISGFEFEGDLLSGFLVDGMPMSWMVRRFRSSDSSDLGWGLTWRPGGRVEFLMVDPTRRPADGTLPARVSGRAIDERRFATIDTVFGRLPPTEVAWSGRTGNWWIRHVDSPMGGLSPMAVQRVLVPGLDGAVQEFVPVEEDWVSPTEDDGAHRMMLHLVSLAHDERVLLPGEDAAVPWTLARRFTFIAVGGDEEALRELHRAVRGWLGRVGRARLEPLADDALRVRNTETGFEIEFREHEVWIAPAIAHLVHSARLVLDLYGIDQLIVSTSD